MISSLNRGKENVCVFKTLFTPYREIVGLVFSHLFTLE